MKRNSNISISLMVIALLLIQQMLSLNTAAQTWGEQTEPEIEKATAARLSDRVVAHAARRGNPFINLTDGRALLTSYAGDQPSALAIASNPRGLSLAADDFDEDGKADLVCGLATADGRGMVSLHRGNSDLIHPNPEAPFLAPARVFKLAVAAEFLASGDFDADGHRDVVAASSTEEALYLLRGDGHSSLGKPERIELSGRVTALVTGDMNRADGLADIVVAVAASDGPKVLVFEGPDGALRRKPEVIALPTEATSLAIGQLDSGYEYDLAVAAGSELLIVHGRDRKLSGRGDAADAGRGEGEIAWNADSRIEIEVAPALISRESFPFNIAAVAIGDFADEGERRAEIAVLSEDGRLQYLQRSDETWQVMSEVKAGEPARNGRRLVRTKVSSLATDDLLMTGRSDQMRIVSGGPGSKRPLHEMTMLDVEGGAGAALPMRLSGHALSDLVILKADGELAVAMVAPMATFTVTNTNDSGPGSLRQAILDANNNPGLDTITFNIASGPVAPASDHRPAPRIIPERPLSEFTDPLFLDGTTQAPFSTAVVELDGSNAGSGANGLTINAGNSVVKGLAIGNFNGHAISLRQRGGNMIMNNFLGTDATCTQNRGNGGEGANIENSNGNTVMGNTIVFNGDGGSVINSNENVIRDNNLGTDSTMTQNKGNQGAGFGFANASNNKFENNRVSFNQFGFIGFGGNGNIFGGDPSLSNIVGRNEVGTSLINSSNNTLQANFFGTNPQGDNLGNQDAAIRLEGNSSNNKIGGGTPNLGNTIAFNPFGIFANPGASGNLYLFNSIFNNSSLGISNNGANRGISRPQLLSATASQTDTLITGRFFGIPLRQYALHFYLNQSSSPPGQGKSPIGGINVTTNSSGMIDFTARAPFVLHSQLTGLATDVTTNDTSDISNPVEVTGTGLPDLEVKKTGPEMAKCREMITWTITVRNVGTAAAIGVRVSDTLPGCVEDEVEVTVSDPQGISYAKSVNSVTTLLPRLDPGAPPVTITIKATLKEDCDESIVNLVFGLADGDDNSSNNSDQVFTKVECTKITGITVRGKHVVVSGLSFQKGDKIDINGILGKTKFRGEDELLVKKGAKSLLDCDPANPGRMNIIRLIRTRDPGAPIIDTEAFATCP
ncbi:MAG: FG-GAP-like repeat-containing protein [Acidobacteriota bacterium]